MIARPRAVSEKSMPRVVTRAQKTRRAGVNCHLGVIEIFSVLWLFETDRAFHAQNTHDRPHLHLGARSESGGEILHRAARAARHGEAARMAGCGGGGRQKISRVLDQL